MINSSTVLNKPSFGEQNYQQKLLFNFLPLQVELDETFLQLFFCIELFINQNYAFPSLHLSKQYGFITKVLEI